MIKNLKYLYGINIFSKINTTDKTNNFKNQHKEELLFVEEELINNYGNIILKEITDKYIVYICFKDELITTINVNKENFIIHNIIINKKYVKKNTKRPKIILSKGPKKLNRDYLKKNFTVNINVNPIIKLVEDWDMEIYKHILKLLNKSFIEVLNKKNK